nr:hypothetical protein [Tanacetum cinerariifolium]
MQTQTSNTLHNAIMKVDSKDRPPMLAHGNYVQWKSIIKRYIDTKPNHELIYYCLKNPPYKFTWADTQVLISEGSPSQPLKLLENCGLSTFLGYGSSGGGKSLPSRFLVWGRPVTGFEAWREKRLHSATVFQTLGTGLKKNTTRSMQISKINDLIGEIIPCSDLFSWKVPAYSAKCLGAPSTSPPHLSSPPRSSIRHETEVPQPSSPTHTHVADEAASTGVDVRHGGATTTVSSLDVGQGSALEIDLKQTKKVYDAAYTKLIMKVKKLEKTVKTRQARRKAKIVESDEEVNLEDPSKQGRSMIKEIDQDAEVTLVTPT